MYRMRRLHDRLPGECNHFDRRQRVDGPINMTNSVHISSLIVHARPECLVDIERVISAEDGAEVPASDPCGKLIVVMETSDSSSVTVFADKIAVMPGVISANLVYHHIDDAAEGTGLAPVAEPNGDLL